MKNVEFIKYDFSRDLDGRMQNLPYSSGDELRLKKGL